MGGDDGEPRVGEVAAGHLLAGAALAVGQGAVRAGVDQVISLGSSTSWCEVGPGGVRKSSRTG